MSSYLCLFCFAITLFPTGEFLAPPFPKVDYDRLSLVFVSIPNKVSAVCTPYTVPATPDPMSVPTHPSKTDAWNIADATQKSMKNVVNSSKINEYNPNVINNSFGSDEKIKKDFFKLNEVIKNNEDVKSTPYQYKFDILKKVANGDIININTPVISGIDAQGTTLIEKVINKQISKKDLELFNSLMPVNGVDQKTKDNMKQFFNFIQANETLIGGVSTFRNFDPTYDSRMNSFLDDMYSRYTDGLKKGLQPKDMLSRNSENFIAKDGSKYTLNRDDVNIQLEEAIKKQSQKQYKVGDVITNSKGEKATVLRIEQNGKVILQKQ